MDIQIFEKIKQNSNKNTEYWSARDLAKLLNYLDFRNFQKAIKRAKESCKNAGQSINYHFVDTNKMINLGKSSTRYIKDISLTRYACYLIMQNADPSKEIVALGQTYFAMQTRKQEVFEQQEEDNKRVTLRQEITAHNKHLAETASQAGVRDYARFTNYGYQGLYGGLGVKQIHKNKKFKPTQKILDFMGSEELAANLFRATQTDAKIKRELIQGEAKANQTHFEVGHKVRQTIRELGGTMPEKLKTTDHINQSKKRLSKSNNKQIDN
jgi:DNA-damage-inducible protein D